MTEINWPVYLGVFSASVLGAVIPAAIYVVFLWWLDRYEKEPFWLLAFAFLWGAIPANVFALIINTALGIPLYVVAGKELGRLGTASLVAPVVEESVKGLALLILVLLFRKEFDNVLDGIIYGGMIGFGFAMTEDFDYFVRGYASGGWEGMWVIILLRPTLFGVSHAVFTSVTGAGIGLARLSPKWSTRLLVVPAAWAGAVFLHALNNAAAPFCCLISLVGDWGAALVILVLIILVWQKEKSWIVEELQEEVEKGLITPGEYEEVSSSVRRFKARWQALREEGWEAFRRRGRFYQVATDLAFKKHHLRTLGDEGGNIAEIERLRLQVSELCGRPMVITCPRCGQALDSTKKFCSSCGAKLEQET